MCKIIKCNVWNSRALLWSAELPLEKPECRGYNFNFLKKKIKWFSNPINGYMRELQYGRRRPLTKEDRTFSFGQIRQNVWKEHLSKVKIFSRIINEESFVVQVSFWRRFSGKPFHLIVLAVPFIVMVTVIIVLLPFWIIWNSSTF